MSECGGLIPFDTGPAEQPSGEPFRNIFPRNRLIRATHPYAFRSGQWARLRGTVALPGFPEGARDCYLAEFPDGVTDFWVINAPGHGYEFLPEHSVLGL